MKHLYSALILAWLPFVAASQPFQVLDISPVPGDHFIQHYAQYIAPNGGGQNTTEDFSGLVSDSSAMAPYVASNSTPAASSFLLSDVAWDNGGGNYTYYHVTADAFEDLGWDLNGNIAVASDPEKWAVFPLGYGTTWTDDHAITFSAGGFNVARSGQVFGQCDANGTTLIMPYGTVTDVKRVYMHDTYTDNVGGFMTIQYDFSYWFYYKAGVHLPVLLVQDLLMTPSIGPATHRLFSVYVDPAEVGMHELATTPAVHVFPQPATDLVNIQFDASPGGPMMVEVFDLSGELLRTASYGIGSNGTKALAVGDLARGSYVLRVHCDDRVLSQRLILV